jgi:hypothetical protein
MYRGFAQLREGWSKNLVLLFPAPGQLAVLRVTEFIVIAGSGVVAGLAWSSHRPRIALALSAIFVTAVAFFGKRIWRAHSSWDADLLSFFGLPVFSYLLLRSKLAHATGNVTWKGRNYSMKRGFPENSPSAESMADVVQH